MTQEDLESTLARLNCAPIAVQKSVTAVLSGFSPEITSDLRRQSAAILTEPNLDWRRECLQKTGHIPSGYTYLAQLMGHDMGCSVPIASVPHVPRTPARPDGAPASPELSRRYNLIENPLTLETIYGAGPILLPHLYDPETFQFRLNPRAIRSMVTPAHPTSDPAGGARAIRSLYDERNRDTLMLHELAVALMQYHNLAVRRLMAKRARLPMLAYAEARAHVVRVWHGILEKDLLPRFVHPVIADLAENDLQAEWMLDEATLLAGLFRAFHALPLAAYRFSGSGPHNLDRLMKSGYLTSFAEDNWKVGWDQFFGATPGGPQTGVSASVAAELQSAGKLIAILDLVSVKKANPMEAGNAPVRSIIARLPAGWPDRIQPEQLAEDFASDHPNAPNPPTVGSLESGPLYQFLMVEAQCHGQNGGFGPLGSALLRASILGSIKRVKVETESPDLAGYRKPETMLDLINLVRRMEEWPQLTT